MMSLSRFSRLLCLLAGAFFGASAQSAELWVDGKAPVDGDGSAERPFRTIGEAMKRVEADDTVTVREGLYREQVTIPKGRPLTLRGKTGERVVISGFEPVTGWQPIKEGLYVATVPELPRGLFSGYSEQPIASEPKSGWYAFESADATSLTDKQHLGGRSERLTDSWIQIYQRAGVSFFDCAVVSMDPETGKLTFKSPTPYLQPNPASDAYSIKNLVSAIREPGEWAGESDPGGPSFKLYWRPPSEAALQTAQYPARGPVIVANDTTCVRLENLEITGSITAGVTGIRAVDLSIEDCVVHNNLKDGVSVRFASNFRIARCLLVQNGNGIGIASTRQAVVEGNEIAYNKVDGVTCGGDLVSYGQPGKENLLTEDVTVSRNYIHHHNLWRHPDNFQIFRGVKDIKFKDNLFLCGGQGLMTEEVDGGYMENNVIVSSSANLILFGHKNSNDWKLVRNTLGLPGIFLLSLTGENYDLRENVFFSASSASGQAVTRYADASPASYTGNHNIFGWIRNDMAGKNAQDGESVTADPLLMNIPKAQTGIRDLINSTPNTLIVKDASGFEAGDTLEINWDGVPRRAVSVEDQTITFTPALSRSPTSVFTLVTSWGKKTSIALNILPQPDSPALKMGKNGAGAVLDVAAYQRGDLEGKGRRTLPELPADVQAGIMDPASMVAPAKDPLR